MSKKRVMCTYLFACVYIVYTCRHKILHSYYPFCLPFIPFTSIVIFNADVVVLILILVVVVVADGKLQVVAYTERSQVKHESRHIQLVREYGFHPRNKTTVEDGSVLPRKYEPFPENMYGRPLEEIDTFIYEEVRS